MLRNMLFCFLLFTTLYSCDSVNSPADIKSDQEIIPLAPGNQWNYKLAQILIRYDNGTTTVTESSDSTKLSSDPYSVENNLIYGLVSPGPFYAYRTIVQSDDVTCFVDDYDEFGNIVLDTLFFVPNEEGIRYNNSKVGIKINDTLSTPIGTFSEYYIFTDYHYHPYTYDSVYVVHGLGIVRRAWSLRSMRTSFMQTIKIHELTSYSIN